MKPFSGFKSEDSSKMAPLPAGAYVAVIKAVKIDGVDPDQTLILRMDVSEGEHAGYFMKRYKADSERGGRFEPKYKGDFRLRIPNDANTRALYPESDRRRFNAAINRIERSNPGYTWDWNEQGLVGKTIGINMQAGTYNDIPFTKIGRLEVADDVRAGLVSPMEASAPRSDAYEPPVDQQTGFQQVTTEELPF